MKIDLLCIYHFKNDPPTLVLDWRTNLHPTSNHLVAESHPSEEKPLKSNMADSVISLYKGKENTSNLN